MLKTSNITGLILAGGRGQRVGENDKGLLRLDGITLIQRQVSWLKQQLPEVIISANRNLSTYAQFGLPVLPDAEANFPGPLSGVLQGLSQMQTEWLFVLPVDVPNLPVDTVSGIVDSVNGLSHSKQTQSAFYLCSTERSHYLLMLLHRRHKSQLIDFIAKGGKRVRDFLNLVNALPLEIGLSEVHFANYNALTDFEISEE